ncbi:hypothetical protein C6341_g5606 [Phytophthora cactorum]|nr:hypothetical protein C6341_g5606 [Phytophthora cactorum]
MSKRVADTQLPPVPHHNDSTAGSQSPTRFLGRLSWDKGMLDNSVSASSRTCKHSARPPAVPSTLAPLASPVKPPVLTSQPSSLKKTEIPVSKPSPTGLKKQLNAGNGSYPMTIEESFDQVEKMLEEHRRQRKEQKPRRVEALSIINEASPLQRHTFVFAPLDDPRILSEIAAQDAVDAREGLKKGESEMDMEVGGSNTKLKYFGPDARTSYYLMYRELHNKPHLFIDRDTHEQHHRGSIRSNLSVAGRRRSTGMRRSLPTLEQAQISVGSGDMNLVSSVPRSPRTLFLGASLAGGQTAPTLLLRKEHNQRTFDLSHQGLGDNFIVRFAACLPELPLVECINVCNNRLTDAGISCLLRALENKPHLTSLDISSNPIGVDAATILRGYIRSNLCTLRVLALNEVSLSDHECARLVKALEHNKSIDRLLLRGNHIGLQVLIGKLTGGDSFDEDDEDEEVKPTKILTGGQALGVMLTANLTLQHLDLSWNQLRAVGCGFIAAALPMNYQLRELDLSYNALGNKGALSLAHALRAGARLRKLTLSYNGISPRGAVGLASGLAVNSSLSMLTLDGNPLGVQGGKALMHASCAPRPTSTVCQLSLLDCSLNVSAPKMSAATGDEQLHVFNPVDPAGSYVLDLSDAYEHMVAHELLRLAVSHPARFHFTKLEYNASTQRGQVTKLEMVKRRIKPSSAPEDTIDTTSSGKSLNPVALMFQRLDEDGSGSVEFSELVNALRSCGLDVSDEQLVELLEKYDYDKSGSLRKREFADLFARVGFDFVDSDNSGSLDTDELRRVFQLLGVTERAEVNDAIARMIAKFEQLVAVLAQPPDDSEISALCEDRRDQEQESTVSNDKKRTQALLHWELLRRFVRSHRATEKRNRNKRRSIAGETMDRLTNTLEGLQQKLQLLEILVADRWLTCVQAQELLSAFPNAVRARARAACLVFSRIIDLENFIQIYDGLSLEDQEECVKRLGWLNIFDPLQPDRQYPPLNLSIYDDREIVQILAQLALQEGTACWQNVSYRPSITSAAGDNGASETTECMSVLPPPGWGRSDAVGSDSVKHHGTVCLRYQNQQNEGTDETQRDTERLILRDRVLCGSRLFL